MQNNLDSRKATLLSHATINLVDKVTNALDNGKLW